MTLSVRVGQSTLANPFGPNEDFAGAATPDGDEHRLKGVALAIADGVGKGRGGGALAESAVREFLTGWYSSPDSWSVPRCLASLLEERNVLARRDHPGAACTFTAVVLEGRNLSIAHVGDSRAYLVREGLVRQLTTDHVWDNPDLRSVLHRAIGLDEGILPQFVHEELRLGDVVLLATDGFHKHIELASLDLEHPASESFDTFADTLVAKAHAAGSDDDATVVLARVDMLPPEDASPLASADADLPPVESPREGLVFDKFRLQQRLGGGRLTSVWLADDREDERRVVLKIPDASCAADKFQREEFLREEWVGKRLQTPGLVPVLTLRPGRRRFLYYAMPWTSGVSLRRILSRDGCFDAFTTTRIGLEVAAALRAMHRKGVLHRDIKPDNLLRDDVGRIWITDLGVARVEVFDDAHGASPGTPSYMAPELFEGHPATEATEIFALGVTLYECLTRKLPFGEVEAFTRPRFGRPVPPSRWNPEIPPWLETVILKAIHPDPTHRFQVLSELEIHLERRERVQDAVPTLPADPERRLRGWIALATIAVLVALLEALALFARR